MPDVKCLETSHAACKSTHSLLLQRFMTAPPEIASQSELLLDAPGATKPLESGETQPSTAPVLLWLAC